MGLCGGGCWGRLDDGVSVGWFFGRGWVLGSVGRVMSVYGGGGW